MKLGIKNLFCFAIFFLFFVLFSLSVLPTKSFAQSAPSCWTCSSGLYSAWIGDGDCDSFCGETSGPGACHSDACAAPTNTPTPTSTPTPTPTPAPSCSNYSNCSTCITGSPYTCGWNGSYCQSGSSSCPGGSQWYWISCSTNVCAPTPTPTRAPTPTPTPFDTTGPTTSFIGSSPADGTTETANFGLYFYDSDTGGSGLNSCYYMVANSVDGWTVGNGNQSSGTARNCNNVSALTITVGPSGMCRPGNTCYIFAYGIDNAGNWSATNAQRAYPIPAAPTPAPPPQVCAGGWLTRGRYLFPVEYDPTNAIGSQMLCTGIGAGNLTNIKYSLGFGKKPEACTAEGPLTGVECCAQADPISSCQVYDTGPAEPQPDNSGGFFYYRYKDVYCCPNPTPTTVTIQGHYVNQYDNFAPANGRNVTITGGALGASTATATNDVDATYLWKKDSLAASVNNFTVAASALTGYTIKHATCIDNINCVRNYIDGATDSTVNLPVGGKIADIYFKYIPTQCTVTTSTASQTIPRGGTGTITASVTGANGAGITMNFNSSNALIATVNPASTSTSPYSAVINAVAVGTTTITATAVLSDGRTCSSTSNTNTTVVTVVPPSNSYVTIQGHYVDQNGTLMPFDGSNPNKTVTISGGTLPSPILAANNPDGTDATFWKRDYLNATATNYTVTASGLPGYTISYATCTNQTNCARTYTNSASVNLPANGNYADIYIKYVPTALCQVMTSPSVYNFILGGTVTGQITATVTGIPAGKTFSRMLFNAYNTIVATVNPLSDSTSLYQTTATGLAAGNTAVWATAELTDNATGLIDTNTCQSSTATDTDIFVVTPTPTPTPVPCQVTNAPLSQTIAMGGTGTITASVTSGLGTSTINQMRFGSYDTAKATATSPDLTSPYSTTVTPVAVGTTAVWATATLSDGRTCQSTAATDTDITVSGGLPIGSGCTNNSQCLSGYCDLTTGTCQNPPTYSISGKIFNDANGDTKSSGDSNYTGAFSVSSTGGSVSSSVGSGTFQISSLPAGQYTVTFGGLAGGYSFTYPPNNLGYVLTVNVGASCSFPGTSEASCSSGNILNLNAGVTTAVPPWIQSVGSDLRMDNGFNNAIPSGKYASVPGTGGMPGIIFSGRSTPNFGSGQASQTYNWQVGSFSNPEVFTTSHNLIPTSYNFLLETAQGSGINPPTATINSSLTHGIYKIDGNLSINAPVTFGTGNFIILINGNLTINANVTVPPGSTAIFSALGNVTVGSSVTQIEGLYSADGNFIVNGGGGCPITADSPLNIAGTAGANAGRVGGTFINNRNLCAGNSITPSVTFTERPDFMLNYPSFVKQIPRFWQET